MKLILVTLALLVSSGAFSQSKKKQIELLQHQLDSISAVNDSLEQALADSHVQAKALKVTNEDLQMERNQLVNNYTLLKTEYRSAIDQINELKKEKENNGKPAQKTTTTTTSVNSTTNPFGDGRTGNVQGGFGSDSGHHSGTGPGNGSPRRTRLTNVDVNDIEIKEDATIGYKLTVDADGNVVAFTHVSSNTTTTDLALINKIGVAIKKQVKYNKVEGSPLCYQFYTVRVKTD